MTRKILLFASLCFVLLSAGQATGGEGAPLPPFSSPAAPAGTDVKPESGAKTDTAQPAAAPWAGHRTLDERITRRNRLAEGHLFPSPVLFRSPLMTARFGFSQGFNFISGTRQVEVGDETHPFKLAAIGAHENLGAGARFLSWLGADLDVSFDALAGVNTESALAMGGITNLELSLGPVFTIPMIKATGTTFSVAARLVAQNGVQITPIGAMSAVAKKVSAAADKIGVEDFKTPDVKAKLFSSTSYSGVRPSVGIVQPLWKVAGLQLEAGFARLSSKKSSKTGEGDESASLNTANIGACLSFDGRHIFTFPLALSLELNRDVLNTEKRTTFGGGLYYQGEGEIQLGAFAAGTVANDPEIENYTSAFGQFTMIYYF